jgi:hypothetical protein
MRHMNDDDYKLIEWSANHYVALGKKHAQTCIDKPHTSPNC